MSETLYLNQEHSLSQLQGFPHNVPGWYGSRTDISFRRPVAPQDQYWRRFLDVYHDTCGTPEAALPSLIRTEHCFVPSDKDVALADELFVQELGKVSRSKSLWRNQKISEGKAYITATAALLRVVHDGGSPGVAQSLIKKGGIIKLSKDPQKQAGQISERHDLITAAARLGGTLLVDYLATISPPERVGEALAIAVKADNVELTTVLLEHGASPDSLFQTIPNHFKLLSLAMLELLLRSPTQPSNSSRGRWLKVAIAEAKLDQAIMLIRYGATLDELGYLNLLQKAVEELHLQAFLVGLKSMHSSGAIYVTGLLQQIVNSADMSFGGKMVATEATLCVALSKDGRAFRQQLRTVSLLDQDMSEALESCASSGQIGLVELLCQPRFGAEVYPRTMESAIRACDLCLLDHLYQKGSSRAPPKDFLLTALPSIEDHQLHKHILQKMLDLQVQGPYLDKELVLATRERNTTLVRSLIASGAKADYNDGEALVLAVEDQHVPLVQELLHQTTEPVRSAVMVRLRIKDRLPRRYMTKLFVERGISEAMLHHALRDSVCECTPLRDEDLIDNLTGAGADYRMVKSSDMHELVEHGDFHSVADTLKRMIKTSAPTMSALASQLLDHVVHCPTKLDDRVCHQMVKLLLECNPTGPSVVVAFEEFSKCCPAFAEEDSDLLCHFLRPTVPNRTPAYNAVVSRVLSSIGIQTLQRLVPNIEIYDEVLETILMGSAHSALSDDASTAERLQCLISRVGPINPIFEQALNHHIRTYTKECFPVQGWPLKTIDTLISKDLAGSHWLCHALLAISDAGNADVLTRVLTSAGTACNKDTVDSVLLLAVQHKPVCNLKILIILLDFGASQNGLDMALLTASEQDQVQIPSLLLQHGADVNYQSGACLLAALRKNQRLVFECLLGQGDPKELSLEEAWITVTEPSSGVSVASKLGYCVNILKAGFRGSQVTGLLQRNIMAISPDYEMITTILEESSAFQTERSFRGYGDSEPGTRPKSQWEPKLLLEALACAIRSGNERICRLILGYLPAGSHIPVDLLNLATSISTAILAMLVNLLPTLARKTTLDLCLVHAASFARNPAVCIYLLSEGASCETPDFDAISAATKRAMQHNASDRSYLEALLMSNPSQAALRSAWRMAEGSLKSETTTALQDFSILRAIKSLQLILSAGLQDIESFQSCICTLCKCLKMQVSRCGACDCDELSNGHKSSVFDCCSARRVQAKSAELVTSLLDHGLPLDYNDGQIFATAAQNHQYEILEILLPRLQTPLAPLEYIVRHGDVRIFYDHSSQTPVEMQMRLKTLRSLVRHGATSPVLSDALLIAVQNSNANVEARQVAELLLEHCVRDDSGAVIRCLAKNPQPETRHLLLSALELETPKSLRLETIDILVSSDLDDDSMSCLILSALCDSPFQLLEMTRKETHKVLQTIAEAGKVEALTLILSCVTDKSILSPFNSISCFTRWLLRSCPRLTGPFLTAVLEWLGPDEMQKAEDRGEGLCLIQEAVVGHKIHLVPLLVSFGATTMTKDGNSLLYGTVLNTSGESSEVLEAVRSLCNDSTVNDGSLHRAVVTMRESIVTLLLEQGHDPNFSVAADHGVPLNMLCATASVTAQESDCGMLFKRLMIKLMMHGAQMCSQIYGRSALFNALDNPRCTVGLLMNVMECFYLSDHLERLSFVPEPSSACSDLPKTDANDDAQSFKTAPSTLSISEDLAIKSFFEFEDKTHHYSATMYLKRDVPCQPSFLQRRFSAQKKVAFLEFLRILDVPDVYYALEGPQPDDAVGVPIELTLGSTECAICGDSVTHIEDAFGKLTEACTHEWEVFMCRECLNGYMASKITVENGAVNSTVSCWAEGCSHTLSHHEIQKYADPALFELYDHALLQQTIHEGETFAECSTQGCNGGGWLESEDVSYFNCHVCQQETCVSHNGPRSDHAGKPCPATPEGQRYAEEEAREEAERQAALVAKNKAEVEAKEKAKAEADRLAKEKKDGLKATEDLMKQISKNCPACKVPIEKTHGCDHMTCRSGSGRAGCGAEWCWNCQVLYTAIRREGNSAHQATCPHYRRNTYLH